MKNLFSILFFLVMLVACTSGDSEEDSRPTEWIGEWKAEWETPPESYPGITDMEFYMDGRFTFTGDSLTVTANGYPGCIFNVDTLSHTQSWKIENDTLVLLNDPEIAGMTYRVRSFSENRVELQLMKDIFVTLTK